MLRRAMWMAAIVGLVSAYQTPVAIADGDEPEAPESAVSSPPMEMDDPGTPGRRGIEINLVGAAVRAGIGRASETLLDANLGIGDRIQLRYERAYVREGAVGEPSQTGVGATGLGVKWRFLDHNGLEAAFYPSYVFDDAFKLKDSDGNPEESEGRSAYFPILLSKQVKGIYTLAVNLGHRRNLEHHGDDNNLALGAGRAVNGGGRILAEIYSERDEHLRNRQTDARVGYVFMLFPKSLESSPFELPAYVSLGHSIGRTEARELSTSITIGMSFIKKPKG